MVRVTVTDLFGCPIRSMPTSGRSCNAMSAAQAVRHRGLSERQRKGGDIVWHLWYLVGAGAGFAAALSLIVRAGRKLRDENTRETRSNMIWSTVGALLMMPLSGVMVSAAVFMVTR